MDESEAVAAFEHLGLTSYEAKVFIALHRIGSGTARDVSRNTDVPRSQVYSAAESLAERGLVNVQQSNPMQYRPVSPESAESSLRDGLLEKLERAFDYVEDVRQETVEEQREDIWTIRGSEAVVERMVELAGEADDRIVFGTRYPELLPGELEASLTDAAAAGLDVVVVTESDEIRGRFAATPATVVPPPGAFSGNGRAGRFLMVDGDSLLLSVASRSDEEMAVWSSQTNFATVMTMVFEGGLGIDQSSR
jgi:sugar-specific transcriptional regulator TrmB